MQGEQPFPQQSPGKGFSGGGPILSCTSFSFLKFSASSSRLFCSSFFTLSASASSSFLSRSLMLVSGTSFALVKKLDISGLLNSASKVDGSDVLENNL
ncbi:hypothetical protein Mapa_010379 [Marchantia paleacea]|nr:hypothetical protein Mapa_010379 [Marchantia paleacea]